MIRIYNVQYNRKCFTSPARLLSAISPQILPLLQTKFIDSLCMCDFMSKDKLFFKEYLYGITSHNYFQDLTKLHGLMGKQLFFHFILIPVLFNFF